MKKLKPFYEAKGHTERTFARSVGLHPADLSRITKNILNPTVPTFRKMLAELACSPGAIATPEELDYSLPEGKHPSPRKDAHKPKFSPRLDAEIFTLGEENRAYRGLTQAQYYAYLVTMDALAIQKERTGTA